MVAKNIQVDVYHVYLLQSKKTGRYYVGQTGNLTDRIKRHNEGRVLSTKSGCPWELVKKRSFSSRREAVQYENKLKKKKQMGLKTIK